MAKWKVVVSDWEYADLRYEEKVLHHKDIQLVPAQCRTEEEVIAACKDADAIINQYAPITRKVLESLEKCRVITRYGVGVNTIDLNAATEKGICVANVPDYCKDEVADHALALLMACTRKIVKCNHHVKSGVWDFKISQPIYRLRGRTIGLVGFGMIPQSLSEKVKPLGLNVIVFDPYIPEEVVQEKGARLVSLDELCQQADIISVHAPLTESTRGMIGRRQFDLMKKGTFIINTSRGPVIDEGALIEALENKKIAGAGLDVVETEPIQSNNPLLTFENVILTPHVAWYSEESAKEMRSKAAMGVVDVLLHGEYPKYLVNQKVKEIVHLSSNQPERYFSL
ncbi:C-terminal binding protein [Microaerobacter geothermalis]|uniref:C-terminal binding protein n=1 Tax=Microaerobacter geothermalis TaxID=674972 RepID=UPI001F2D4F09|nr:C-terminal binding protein [Microaerobacter geothermalis]MCF6092409.1 C-terminal binding protein [Microaerobacter geothermalis]